LRDNGQRLAIKLIQLSSGILEKSLRNSRPNDAVLDDDINVQELEELVDKLHTVNQTLSCMYFSFTDSHLPDRYLLDEN
jgi:hypothetical protein